MRATQIDIVRGDGFCLLQALIASDRGPNHVAWFEPFTLWFRYPSWVDPHLRPDHGDPFLAALLVPAMMTDERLQIDAPVSPRLLRQLSELQAIYHCFDRRLKPIVVEAPAQASAANGRSLPATGLFFSLGVDSFYSLFKNHRDHPDDDETVRFLIALHGIDVRWGAWDDQFPPEIARNLERVAQKTGKTLVPVVTNFRWQTQQIVDWTMSHGAMFAAVALALDSLLDRVLIAAGTTYDDLYPWGDHPLLYPLWSNERLQVIHDGLDMSRIDKVRFIADSELVLDTLRVCGGYTTDYNCGACSKCLPTMIDLLQLGKLGSCRTLPNAIDAAALRAMLHAHRGALADANYRRRLTGFDVLPEYADLREVLAAELASESRATVRANWVPAAKAKTAASRLLERAYGRARAAAVWKRARPPLVR